MSTPARFWLVLILVSGFVANGCSKDPLSGPPDFKGIVLANYHPHLQEILMSVDSATWYQTDKIVIHINNVIDMEELGVDQKISVWLGEDKAVMASNPPQAVAKKIEIGK